jgi:hypothetical protein
MHRLLRLFFSPYRLLPFQHPYRRGQRWRGCSEEHLYDRVRLAGRHASRSRDAYLRHFAVRLGQRPGGPGRGTGKYGDPITIVTGVSHVGNTEVDDYQKGVMFYDLNPPNRKSCRECEQSAKLTELPSGSLECQNPAWSRPELKYRPSSATDLAAADAPILSVIAK